MDTFTPGTLPFRLDPPGMPVHQKNAHLGEELVMRVGIPHKGGRLSFHAFNESYPVMVSASAFWNPNAGVFSVPEATNLTELDMALDSAGFTAMLNWKAKGRQAGMAGVFPWTYVQYCELASTLSPAWWSQPDMCCEPEICTDQAMIGCHSHSPRRHAAPCLRLAKRVGTRLLTQHRRFDD